MIRRFLGTTLGQILAIIASSSVITFLLFLLMIWTLFPGPPPPPPWPWPSAYRISMFVENFRSLPEQERAAALAAANRPELSIRPADVPTACDGFNTDAREMQEALTTTLYDPSLSISTRSCGTPEANAAGNIQVLAKFNDRTLEFRARRVEPARFSRLTFPFVGALLFLCVAVAAMSAWAVWRVIGPLRRLSEKADAFGGDIAVAAIEEEGPIEIRRAARAFNLMQARITRSIQERTRTLAAISHDLRTPLTRMRLVLETSPPGDMQAKLLRNVTLMQSMVTSALAFLSGHVDQEEQEWLDLGALLQTLRDEFEEAGFAVRYVGPERMEYFCRPSAMARALTNLIENACHFGNAVSILARPGADGIVVDVEDDGPGIPADHRLEVIEPFVRLDPSRTSRAGSVGLGLSIVDEILSRHGGTLELLDRPPHGLIARISLPTRSAEG